MSVVLGVDTSLTSTGVAIVSSDPVRATTHRVESSPPRRAKGDKRPASIAERNERIAAISQRVFDLVSAGSCAQLAVVEAPSYGSQGGSSWDRAWLWGQVISGMLGRDIPVAIVPPMSRAVWATGSGRSSKGQIAVPMSRMWPDIDAGIADDEWDALSLASMGAQYLGILPVELGRHRDQLAKISWPDFPAGVVAA
jgi:crossover junction endodeoxyribonuclease RuvC